MVDDLRFVLTQDRDIYYRGPHMSGWIYAGTGPQAGAEIGLTNGGLLHYSSGSGYGAYSWPPLQQTFAGINGRFTFETGGFGIGPDGLAYTILNTRPFFGTPALYTASLLVGEPGTSNDTRIGAANALPRAEGDLVFHEGALWYASVDDRLIEVDPTTGAELRSFSHGIDAMQGLTSTSEGLLGYAGSEVYRLDPAAGTATHLPDQSLPGEIILAAASAPGHVFGNAPRLPADALFADGYYGTLATLAMAAYHLDTPRELVSPAVITPRINNVSRTGEAAFALVEDRFDLLDAELGGLTDTGDAKFPRKGFGDGIYTNENAAALVARGSDALFIAFRGTNDNAAAPTGALSPDMRDWLDRDGHADLFLPLFRAVKKYARDNAAEIDKIYVTGHSLGAAMVEALLDQWNSRKIEAVTFASPGIGLAGTLDNDRRITNFWIEDDPILLAAGLSENNGAKTLISTGIREVGVRTGAIEATVTDGTAFHSMTFYKAYADLFDLAGLGPETFGTGGGSPVRVIAPAQVAEYTIGRDATLSHTLYIGEDPAGAGPDQIVGTRKSDIVFGDPPGNGVAVAQTLVGKGGNDTLLGGDGADRLEGGKGQDVLLGGLGPDVFVFAKPAHATSFSARGQPKPDAIADFDGLFGGDLIDLSGIDAKTGLLRNRGDQAFDFLGETGFTGTKGELIFVRKTAATLVKGDRDGDGDTDILLRIEGVHVLDAGDFLL